MYCLIVEILARMHMIQEIKCCKMYLFIFFFFFLFTEFDLLWFTVSCRTEDTIQLLLFRSCIIAHKTKTQKNSESCWLTEEWFGVIKLPLHTSRYNSDKHTKIYSNHTHHSSHYHSFRSKFGVTITNTISGKPIQVHVLFMMNCNTISDNYNIPDKL